MVIIEAKILLYDNRITKNWNIQKRFLCSICFSNIVHIAETKISSDSSIALDVEYEAQLCILTGEMNLEEIKEGNSFKYLNGDVIGEGEVIKVKEIYVDKDIFKYCDDLDRIKNIIKYIESLDNSIIFEDVYSLLENEND